MASERSYDFVLAGQSGRVQHLTTVCREAKVLDGSPPKVGSAYCEKWCEHFISVNQDKHTVVCSATLTAQRARSE